MFSNIPIIFFPLLSGGHRCVSRSIWLRRDLILLLNHLILGDNLELLLFFSLSCNCVSILFLHRVNISTLKFQTRIHDGLNSGVHLFPHFRFVRIIILNLYLFLRKLFGILLLGFFSSHSGTMKNSLMFRTLLDMRDVWRKKRRVIFPVLFLVTIISWAL